MRRGRRRARGWVREGRGRPTTRGLALGAGPRLPGALGRSRTCCPRWSASFGAAMGDVCDTGGLFFFLVRLFFTGQPQAHPPPPPEPPWPVARRQASQVPFPGLSKGVVVGFSRFLFSHQAPLLHCPLQAVISAKYQRAIDYDASMISLLRSDFFVSH